MARIQGEAAQKKGREGVRRAKRWLESTSRVEARWVNPDNGADRKLRFSWPEGGQSFSYDLGGLLRYGNFEGDSFYAEVKAYEKPQDLGTHWRDFLAHCYVTYRALPAYSDHFLWISWSPHLVNSWDTLTCPESVRAAVLANSHRIFPIGSVPEQLIDEDACSEVAKRVWLIVLNEKQEKLVPSIEHISLIHTHERSKEAAS